MSRKRRLSARDGALLKLDFCEAALQRARAAGDDNAWVRYYQAWLRLHALAFGYGRWAGGPANDTRS